MGAMKLTARWLWMLTKRLYRRKTFLAVLALIPLLAVGYGLADFSDSGVLTVALAQEGQDPLAAQLILELEDDSQLVRYVSCQSAGEARQLVRQVRRMPPGSFRSSCRRALPGLPGSRWRKTPL